MKKYYCITVLALIVVTLLQGYNMSLQYKNYILNETDKINSVLRIAIDEEYAIRAHKNKHSHNDGKQRVYYKSMTEEDFLKAKPKKEDIIDFDEIIFTIRLFVFDFIINNIWGIIKTKI